VVGDIPRQTVRVLISGASVAGPMAAYWLCRQGFAVTVVERMPLTLVRTSGHAVDLFGPAMDVAEWTGVLPAVTDARTRTEIVSFQRLDGRGVDVDVRRLVAGISGRHVEIMRGELATILYEATFMRRPEATRGICSRTRPSGRRLTTREGLGCSIRRGSVSPVSAGPVDARPRFCWQAARDAVRLGNAGTSPEKYR